MNKYLVSFFILIFFTIPLLAPFRVDLGFLYATPEGLKSFYGVNAVLMGTLFWLIASYKQIKIYYTRAYLPIALFIIWNVVSLLWVEDGYLAILTLAQFISYALIFFLITNVFQDKKSSSQILYALISSLTVVSTIGLLQYYLIDVDLIQNIFAQNGSLGATFGNKNMASHFIVMTLPLSFVLLLATKNNQQVIVYSITTFVGTLFLIFIMARQAYVAIGIEILILFLFLILDKWKNKDKNFLATMEKRKVKSVAIVFILFLLVLFANLGNQGFNNENNSISKIERIQSILVNEHNGRLPAWRNTIEMIKDHPISGVGVGQWAEAYPLYYDRIMKDKIFNEKTRLKRLHNDYLEMFANVGFIGIGLLIWLVYLVANRIWKILKKVDHQFRIQTLGLTLGLTGFAIVAMFSFPIEVYLPAFLAMSYIAIIFLKSSLDKALFLTVDKKIITYFFISILIIFSIFILNSTYKWLLGEHFYHRALIHEKLNQPFLAAGAGLEALKNNNWSPKNYAITGNNVSKTGKYKEGTLFLKKAIDISPFNTTILLNLAETYRLSEDIDMEKKVLDFIIRFDTKNVIAHARLVRILIDRNNYTDANIVYSNMKSSFNYFNGRSGFGPYHEKVASIAIYIRDYEYAKYVYEDAIDKNLDINNYVKLATLEYFMLDHKKIGINLYKKVLSLDSNIPKNKEIKVLIQEYESTTKH